MDQPVGLAPTIIGVVDWPSALLGAPRDDRRLRCFQLGGSSQVMTRILGVAVQMGKRLVRGRIKIDIQPVRARRQMIGGEL